MAALLVACESSRAPASDPDRPGLVCGEHRTLQVVPPDARGDSFAVCLDQAGRYDGPTAGAQVRGETRVDVRGQFEHEVPSGTWVCTRMPGGERLTFDVDPDRWAAVLWGTEPGKIGPMKSAEAHLAPTPANLCPRQDWAGLARDGYVIDSLRQLGDLVEAGVIARVRHAPAR